MRTHLVAFLHHRVRTFLPQGVAMNESPSSAPREVSPTPLCQRSLLQAAPLAGTIKLRPEDFLVEELPLYDLTGDGEHVQVGSILRTRMAKRLPASCPTRNLA